MGTYRAPLVADLILFCFERVLMLSLSDNKEGDVIKEINSTLRYLDGYLNIGNPYFEHMASRHISQKFK